MGQREGSWRIAKQGKCRPGGKGLESSRVRPVWGQGRCFQRREGVWPRRDKPPGRALASNPSRGGPATGWALQERRQQDRGCSQSLRLFPGMEQQLLGHYPSPMYFCPECELGRDYTVRSTSLSLPAGLLNYSWEGRVQKITGHWLTHANTFHRTRRTAWNRLQVWKLSGQALPRACSSEGRTARAAGEQHSTGMPLAFGQPSHKETTGFTWTKNAGAKPDEGELITKAIYPRAAVATHRQPTRSDLLLRKAASLNEGGRT